MFSSLCFGADQTHDQLMWSVRNTACENTKDDKYTRSHVLFFFDSSTIITAHDDNQFGAVR